jgi:O-antigen ligase
MMMGTVPTSVSQFILLGNWLLEADFARKWKELKSNKLFWILSSVFLMSALGLLWTSDMKAGWDDVRTKIPLMFLPMIFMSTKPLSKREFYLVSLAFLLGCFLNVSWCYLYTFILHKNETVRSASRFMSHIRLGLYLNMGIAFCVYFVVIYQKLILRMAFVLLAFCFLFSMYALGLASGFTNFFLLAVLGMCWLIYRLNFKMKVALTLVLAGGLYAVGHYVYSVYALQAKLNDSPYNSRQTYSASGRDFFHFENPTQKENGNLVHLNLQLDEIQKQWKLRSPRDSFSYNPQYNIGRYQILIRYLTSKGLNKDSLGVWSLNEDDVNNIRNGVTNYMLPRWSYLHKRIYELVNEYDEFKNKRHVNGHSLSMRLYFWSTAFHVIKENFFTGVGTGDVQAAMNTAYKETRAPLKEEWYKRPHNQYLTFAVALGIFALLMFLLALIYPFIALRKFLPVLYLPFFAVAIISFFVEDTLETQAGVTFFAFFNSFFLAMGYHRKTSG